VRVVVNNRPLLGPDPPPDDEPPLVDPEPPPPEAEAPPPAELLDEPLPELELELPEDPDFPLFARSPVSRPEPNEHAVRLKVARKIAHSFFFIRVITLIRMLSSMDLRNVSSSTLPRTEWRQNFSNRRWVWGL